MSAGAAWWECYRLTFLMAVVRNDGETPASKPPAITDEQKQAEQAMRESAHKLDGINRRHQKELKSGRRGYLSSRGRRVP